MAKFNTSATTSKTLASRKDVTTNAAGGQAFTLSPKMRLYQTVCSSLVSEPKYYKTVIESKDEHGNKVIKNFDSTDALIIQTIQEVAKEDPEFVLALARYAREEMHLRSVPLLLLGEAANLESFKAKPGQKNLVKEYTPLIIKRADELTEILAYHFGRFDHNVPHGLLRGIKNSVKGFDQYSLGKYNRDKTVKMKDMLRLVHPKPKDETQSVVFKKLLDDTLESPETWEVILSDWKGKGFASKKAAWEHIVDNVFCKDGKVFNYMAILRNVRNILDEKVSQDHMQKVIAALRNENAVKYSKQLPFRFYSAYRELEKQKSAHPLMNLVLDALEDAMEISCQNLPEFKGVTFITADESGSMNNPLSAKSSMTYQTVGNLMAAISQKHCEMSITSAFGENFQIVNTSKRSGIFDNLKKMEAANVGHSTYGYKALQYLIENKVKVDRVMIFTDCELYNAHNSWGNVHSTNTIAALFKNYKSSINPNTRLYVFNLAGMGDMCFPEDEKNVCLLSGWSEKVLSFVQTYEQDASAALAKIEQYKLSTKSPQ